MKIQNISTLETKKLNRTAYSGVHTVASVFYSAFPNCETTYVIL